MDNLQFQGMKPGHNTSGEASRNHTREVNRDTQEN